MASSPRSRIPRINWLIAMSESAVPLGFGKSKAVPAMRGRAVKRLTACGGKGTLCSRLALVCSAGIDQSFLLRSISSHVANLTDPDRTAVNTKNSRALALVLFFERSFAMKSPTAVYGTAGWCLVLLSPRGDGSCVSRYPFQVAGLLPDLYSLTVA